MSRSDALRLSARLLAEAGLCEARTDARHLILNALGLTPTELALRGREPVGPAGAEAVDQALRRRLSGEPVARILGQWEFWGLPFVLSERTLVPRPDTETLVETALAVMDDCPEPRRILDLGTGSGCILVALLRELPDAFGIGTDLSLEALDTARRNAWHNGVGDRAAFIRGDWCDALRGPFDLVVSNPPYIASDAIAGLAVEVRCHDPHAALDGGGDGLDAYRIMFRQIAGREGLLAAHGVLVVEIGYDQAEAVARLGTEAGFAGIEVRRDLAGHARVVTLRPPLPATDLTNDGV